MRRASGCGTSDMAMPGGNDNRTVGSDSLKAVGRPWAKCSQVGALSCSQHPPGLHTEIPRGCWHSTHWRSCVWQLEAAGWRLLLGRACRGLTPEAPCTSPLSPTQTWAGVLFPGATEVGWKQQQSQ